MEKLIASFLFIVIFSNVFAFDYFNDSIDYWNEKSQKTKTTQHKAHNKKERKEKKTFNWNRYLNPKTNDDLKEVFREGNYRPPAPLLEVAKNPTDENIKRWFQIVKKKNEFLTRINHRMSEYLKKNNQLKAVEKNLISSDMQKLKVNQIDFKRFRFRMYFESSCPHCKNMMGELIKLQDMGFFIELRQIDNNKRYAKALPFVTKRASKKELREKKVNAWPVLFIGDNQKKLIYRINGYQSASNILATLQSK